MDYKGSCKSKKTNGSMNRPNWTITNFEYKNSRKESHNFKVKYHHTGLKSTSGATTILNGIKKIDHISCKSVSLLKE